MVYVKATRVVFKCHSSFLVDFRMHYYIECIYTKTPLLLLYSKGLNLREQRIGKMHRCVRGQHEPPNSAKSRPGRIAPTCEGMQTMKNCPSGNNTTAVTTSTAATVATTTYQSTTNDKLFM